MKDIKKQLLKELNSRVPKMSDELKNYPITTSVKKSRMPRFSFYMIGAVACLLVLAIILPITLKTDNKMEACYLFEVNPSVLVVTDKDGKVTKMKSCNEDADELLLGVEYDELIGEDISEVSITLVDHLIRLGYFDSNSYENIMKISSMDSNVDVEGLISDYAASKGYFVAILEEELSFSTVNDIFESSVSNISELKDYIDSSKNLIIEGTSTLINYEKEYKKEYLSKYLLENVLTDLELLSAVENCLIELNTVYDNISELSLLKDYWIIKSFYASNPDAMDENLKALVNQMESLLNDYYNLTQRQILSGPDLKLAYAYVSAVPIEEIEELINNINEKINSYEFESTIESLINFINLIDEDAAKKLKKYSKIPSDANEYIDMVKDMQLDNYNTKIKKYESEYNKTKNSIKKEEYQQKINELIKKYGSLENFWNKK